MDPLKIPVFPLHSVLFPDGKLPLRVFEPRYTDMISQCLKENIGFGICLIREGSEVGQAAAIHEVGTLASIIDWHMRKDGLLGVIVKGEKRFRIKNLSVAKNQLITADVEYYDDEPLTKVPDDYLDLVEFVEEKMARLNRNINNIELDLSDASCLSFRLAELLPLRLSQKQYFLQLNEPLLRLERIDDVLQQLDLE